MIVERRNPDPLGDPTSGAEVDVVVPVGPNDVEVIHHCLEGIERNLRGPVGCISLVAPRDLVDSVRRSVPGDAVVVADEEVFDQETRTSLLGHLSSGAGRWRAQQLLKLSVPEVTTADAIVVIDADTILVRPRRFRDGDRTLLLATREFNIPYYEAAARLWRESLTLPAFSCVAHQMCFIRNEVVALRDEIEARWNMDWRSAIVQASGERKGFAESELYGQWRLRTRPELCVVRGFHNVSLRRSEIRSVVELERQVGRGVYSVSCHYWL